MNTTSKTGKVKRRTYNSERRRSQAASTRRDILDAAQFLFEQDGYNATTMTSIANEAGVVVETIYRNFGGKAGLIQAVVEVAVAGSADRAEIVPEDRPAIRRVIEEPDPREKLTLYAATQPGIHERAGKLRRALREGALIDAQLAQAHEQLEAQPYHGLARFAQHLKDVGALKVDLSVDEARDLLWSINSLSMYELLVGERGWSAERYQNWLISMMTQSLLA